MIRGNLERCRTTSSDNPVVVSTANEAANKLHTNITYLDQRVRFAFQLFPTRCLVASLEVGAKKETEERFNLCM